VTKIRAAFRYGDTRLFSRLVTFFRGGDSAHCEVAWAWIGHMHECVSASYLDGGVRAKVLALPPKTWRIYELDSAVEPLEWYCVHSGSRYDVLGLLGILWPRIGHQRRRWFCSEVLAAIIGLPEPQLYDLRVAESVCAKLGVRIQ
jgi:hypothetical protein